MTRRGVSQKTMDDFSAESERQYQVDHCPHTNMQHITDDIYECKECCQQSKREQVRQA